MADCVVPTGLSGDSVHSAAVRDLGGSETLSSAPPFVHAEVVTSELTSCLPVVGT